MPQFDGIPRTEPDNVETTTVGVVEELYPRSHANLARGIVWADILADIAADEEARHLRDAA